MIGPRACRRPATLEDAADLRQLDCTNARACLEVAIRRGWPAFTCSSCTSYQPPDQVQQRRDVIGLMALQGLAGIGSESDS